MKDNELITRKNIEIAFLNKGQCSRRYKLGDKWELNYDEIREVLNDIDADVQSIERCKDCIYCKKYTHILDGNKNYYCSKPIEWLSKDDFCSYGKNKFY